MVPSSLGYGQKGFESAVPPNSVLNFEVTLLRIKSDKDNAPEPSDAPLPSLPSSSPTMTFAEPEEDFDRQVSLILFFFFFCFQKLKIFFF